MDGARDPRTWVRNALEILEIEARALEGLRDRIGEGFVEVVRKILDGKGRVVLTGMGKAGLIAQKISATLASTGTPSIYLHPAEAVHGDLGRVVEGDMLIALSKSGETDEVLKLLPIVKASGVTVVAMTESGESTLGRNADHLLELGPIDEAGPHGLAPSASTLVMLALGDAVALVVQAGRGFGPEEFARFHPSGSLGRQLMRVPEVMRKAEAMPVVRSGTQVREALVTMTETPGRPGAVLILGRDDELLGIFTDGDLRRLIQTVEHAPLEKHIDEVMSRHPVTIQDDKLVAEAQAMLQRTHKDQVPVVDAEGRAVGLLDVQDLWAFKIG